MHRSASAVRQMRCRITHDNAEPQPWGALVDLFVRSFSRVFALAHRLLNEQHVIQRRACLAAMQRSIGGTAMRD